MRLVDLAGRDVIAESPLLTVEAAGEVETRALWHHDFEGEAMAELGWLPEQRFGGGARLSSDPDHGQIVCFRGRRVEDYPILIRARPLRGYRVTRVLRTDWPSLDLRVVESSVKLTGRKAVNLRRMAEGAFVGKSSTLAVHRFTPSSAPGDWDRAEVEFSTSLDTRTLALLFDRVPEPSRPADAEACLAELTIETIETTAGSDLARLKDAWPGPGSSDLGLVKRGRLLPLRRLAFTKQPYDENHEFRDALFAPAPTRLRFPVDVPAGGRLTFSYALSAGSRIGDEAAFEIVVEHGGGNETVFSDRVTIGKRGRGWHWRGAAVELGAWSGERIVLELRTASSTPRGFALWGNPIVDAPRRVDEPPNIIIIGIDTLRADRVSSYGYHRPTTPNLDRLAAEGIRFDQAVSAAGWTSPSFASILTGLPVARHGVVDQEFAMSSRVKTLAEHLRAGGWRTHAIVYKAALFGLGLEQGFDRWFNLPTSHRTAQVNLDKALAWLEAHHDRRFFLFLHLDDPHQPFNQPAPFDLKFGVPTAHEELDLELPISIRNGRIIGCPQCMQSRRLLPDFVKVAQDLYDGAVAYTDDRIGALLDALAKYGIYDDTVIAVVADHGELIYDRYRAWGHPGAGLTDDQIRVPLILKGARGDSFEPGEVVKAQVRTTDLLPTLLESAGLDSGVDSVESLSLWPLANGEETRDRVAFIESPAHGVLGLRTPAWKYVLRTRPSGQSHHSLYDLHGDPDERDNVAHRRPSELARLAEELAPFILRTRPGPFLLVLGDGEPGSFQLVLEKDDEVGHRSFIGLPPTLTPRAGDGDMAVGGRVLALVQLDLPAGRAARASFSSAGRTLISRVVTLDQLEPYAELDLDRLSRQPTPAIYFLRGAPPISPVRTAATTSPDQLEDLRALGYID